MSLPVKVFPITNSTLAKGAEEEGKTSSSDQQRVVSWAYPDWQQQAPPLSIIHPKPPYYHDSLFNERPLRHDPDSFGERGERYRSEACEEEDVVPDADELNVHLLVGAKSAEDTLRSYEIDVGFYYPEPDSSFELEADRSLCKLITDDAIAIGKERWAQLVQNLTGGHISSFSQSRRDSGAQDLRSPTSSEFFDLTDSENSEHSVDSDPVPSTPKPRSYANVTVKQSSPTPLDYSPSRSLNASASLFVPTSTPVKFPSDVAPSSRFWRAVSSPSPSPSPTHSNFTFPSLNNSIQSLPILPPTLKKDEQGFYTAVTPSSSTEQTSTSNRAQRSSMSLLPPFLADPSRRTRKTSKTRKIIDQLRSASVNGFDTPTSRGCVPIRSKSTPHQLSLVGQSLSISTDGSAHWLEDDVSQSPIGSLRSTAASFEKEDDGWLRADVEDTDGDSEAKARRTRDLVQALGRNRPDSTHESDSDVNYRDTGWEVFTQPTDGPKKSPKETSTRRKAPRQRSRKAHNGYRGPSASSPGAPPMALPLSSLSPTQPFFSPFPIYSAPFAYADSSYNKSMQMPTQTHCFPAHAAYTGSPFGPITLFPPVLQLPTSVSMNMQGSITGNTGMRHTLW